ncbi:MAG: threonylcarbamoyl-AMP synthase [Anaerolineaceae bacterium]|nr:MAG: threonylcarbamoyl-AMP synthase [Anaerolineaceae bacterium]
MTELLPATPENIAIAAGILRDGGLVAFPTETVYGLGANALNVEAVERIFRAKRRPTADPLIVHLSELFQIDQVASVVSSLAQLLATTFWPGPLTLILPKRTKVPDLVTSGLQSVAVRIPDHPVALHLIAKSGVPVAAPSANLFGHTSPTTAQHVWQDLAGQVDVILDAGETSIGVESTVLDLSTNPARILRPGGVTHEMLESLIGPVTLIEQMRKPEKGLPSPGLLERHYSPRARMVFFKNKNAKQALLAYCLAENAAGKKVGALVMDDDVPECEQAGATAYALGSTLDTVARRVYSGMRWLDEQGVGIILAGSIGESGLGLAIRDRLMRAASVVIGEEDQGKYDISPRRN